MSTWLSFCPQPPTWQIDWQTIRDALAWVDELEGCPQDPVHHAEGDVWTHTRMACEVLTGLPSFRERAPDEQRLLFMAVLLHDVGKPACTRTELDGRITSRGHSRRGAILARSTLWRLGVPIAIREQIASLIRHHQVPFFLAERPDSRRLAIEASQTVRCDDLALLAEADARGRHCGAADQTRLLDNVAFFAEYCREQGCLAEPYPFPSDHARFLYFRRPHRDPDYPAYDDTRCVAVLLSGLPGAGKDHWAREHLADRPMVSLDALRAELGIPPTKPQGPVVERAREMAKGFLRQGRDFVWNGTNISREMRERSISLFAAYKARVRIVYLEASEVRLLDQNRSRSRPVPEVQIERLLSRWEAPDRTEAHTVDWIVRS